jgi:hypothetical protein
MCDLGPHEQTLAAAERVREIVEGQVPVMRRTPPRAAFRDSRKGRRAWLEQAGRQLKREQYESTMLLDRDLPRKAND